jgi:hypothetical protein
MNTNTLDTTVQLGEPLVHAGIAITPLYPRLDPVADYVTLEDALPLGFQVTELDASGSVPELAVHNPTDHDVLLYDGEELLGAKQNRILNVTVLVAAGAKTVIPVSCVEEGRWAERSAAFSAAPQAANPELRRRKSTLLSAEPLTPGLAQYDVWDTVRAEDARLGVASPTRAHSDAYRSHDRELDQLASRFPLAAGQCGALVAVGEQLCLDYLSRPAAFARLYSKLLRGYLLDALGRDPQKPTDSGAFLAAVSTATRARRHSVGRGHDLRLHGPGVTGSGLELDGELIQLSAFSTDDHQPRAQIARPSRRS